MRPWPILPLMVDNPRFERARDMLYEATELVMLLMEYIQGIKV